MVLKGSGGPHRNLRDMLSNVGFGPRQALNERLGAHGVHFELRSPEGGGVYLLAHARRGPARWAPP